MKDHISPKTLETISGWRSSFLYHRMANTAPKEIKNRQEGKPVDWFKGLTIKGIRDFIHHAAKILNSRRGQCQECYTSMAGNSFWTVCQDCASEARIEAMG